MKIAFCVISNRPEKALRFAGSFQNAMVKGHDYWLCLSYEKPYTNKDLWNIILPKGVKLIADERKPKKTKLFNYIEAREHSYNLAKNADYIIHCDDDFIFTDGSSTKNYRWTSGSRYLDCIRYLERDEACGAVVCKGFLGGSHLGRTIVPMVGGFYETGLGVVLRGRHRPYPNLIHPIFTGALGTGEDAALPITPMFYGYYVAKAFNCTTRRDITKKVVIAQGKSRENEATNPNYNWKMISERGTFARFIKTYGPYTFGGKLPRAFIEEYREQAHMRGLKIVL